MNSNGNSNDGHQKRLIDSHQFTKTYQMHLRAIKLNSLSASILNPVTSKQKQDVLNQVSQRPLSLHALCFSVSTCPNIIHNIVT